MHLITIIVVLAVGAFSSVEPHGAMKRPPSRSALGLDPNFDFPLQPKNWNYHEVWCGNNPQDVKFLTCGRCGDRIPIETDFGGSACHDNVQGGYYGRDYIAANYSAGQIIEVEGDFVYAHYGYFEVELCPFETETDDCFQTLDIVGGSTEVNENRICVPYESFLDGRVSVTAMVQLPEGVTCRRCTLRWNYRTSSVYEPDWNPCFTPIPVQAFRNCADIAIL